MNGLAEKTGLLLPVIFIAGGLLLGIFFDRFVIARLKKITAGTRWAFDDIIIAALRGKVLFWFLIAGAYGGIASLSIDPATASIFYKILLGLIILSVTLVFANLAAGFINFYAGTVRKAFPKTTIFTNLTKASIFIIGGLIILQVFGIPITPLLTALGVGGLAVALALQDTLSNLFSGLHLIAAGRVKVGDYVKLDTGEEGYVTDITWRNTALRTLPNNIVIIPNSKLAAAIVTNYSLPEKEMAVLVNVGVSYDANLAKVEKTTIDVAREVMKEVVGAVPEFEPFIRYHTFADSGINFTVILRGKEFVDQYAIKHEFIKRLHERYRAEGIEIPYPQRVVHMKEK